MVDSTGQRNTILSAEVCGGEDRSTGDVGCVAGAAVGGDVEFGEVVQRCLSGGGSPAGVDPDRDQPDRWLVSLTRS